MTSGRIGGTLSAAAYTPLAPPRDGAAISPTPRSPPHAGLNFTVGRVSYTFGFQGPCIGLDTACSSSLVATHLAHRGLLDGETGAAVSAGSNLSLVASTAVNLAQLGALTANGRSKTFDASADGYGRGEAVIAWVLRLPGSSGSGAGPVLALLHGSAYNQDGRSSGLTAPNGPAQTTLVRTALAAAGAAAGHVGLVSMHGTGESRGPSHCTASKHSI